jgi:hypothetical protein
MLFGSIPSNLICCDALRWRAEGGLTGERGREEIFGVFK